MIAAADITVLAVSPALRVIKTCKSSIIIAKIQKLHLHFNWFSNVFY